MLTGSPAEAAGVQAGDLLVSVAGEPVASAAEAHEAIVGVRPGDRVGLKLLRGEETIETTLTASGGILTMACACKSPGPILLALAGGSLVYALSGLTEGGSGGTSRVPVLVSNRPRPGDGRRAVPDAAVEPIWSSTRSSTAKALIA